MMSLNKEEIGKPPMWGTSYPNNNAGLVGTI